MDVNTKKIKKSRTTFSIDDTALFMIMPFLRHAHHLKIHNLSDQ